VDLAQARARLTDELAELDERARFAEQSRSENAADPNQEGGLGQHAGDYGAEVTSSMESALLVETVQDQRRTVTAALARVDDGTYGRCAVCDREIDDERLDARPEVRTCREHADTPVEG
jgi:RNA polymerase-binding transcription factor DksA